MGSVSTIYNGVRTWLAGRALMDVAFSDRSTNGVQNKVIKAKFDEVDEDITQLNSDLTTKLNSYITYEMKVDSFTADAYRQYNFDSDDYLAFALPCTGSYLTNDILCTINPTSRIYGIRNMSTHDQTITVTVIHVKK